MEMKDMLQQHAESIDVTMTGFGESLKKSIDTMGSIDLRIKDIEQKLARRGGGPELKGSGSSIGDIVVANDALGHFAADVLQGSHRPGRIKVETKAILLSSDSASVGQAQPHPYRDAAVMIPQRSLVVRSLLPVIEVSTGSVEYPHQTARDNNAATVAEGPVNPKPQSDFTMELKNTPVRTIAHWMQASNQIMADMPQLKGMIDTELLYGLAFVEDTQLLLGDGTGTNLTGLVPQATPFAPVGGLPVGSTFLDELGYALLQVALSSFSPDGIVLNPTDWWRIRLLKDAQGKYLFGDPGAEVEPRIFGLPVVTSLAMPVGHFLVGQFMVAATLYDRMQATIMVSSEDRDNFIKNLLTILAEERIALAVKRGAALVYGSFT